MRTALLLMSLLLAQPKGEVEWSAYLAPGLDGRTEVRLFDDARVDILNSEYAIEVEWAKKWPEAIGQCQYYSIVTGKKPAVLLLIKDKKSELRYIHRCLVVCTKLDIKLLMYDTQKERYLNAGQE